MTRSPWLLVLVLGCASEQPNPEPELDPWPLDVALGPGEVRCGPVTRESELIGGPGAYGEVGRAYRCYNDAIRFIVQDGSRPIGQSVRGGDLIDLDLVRADELAPGWDTFRELAPGVSGGSPEVESVTVLNDGRDGGPGIIRVSGAAAPAGIIPVAAVLYHPIDATVHTDYVLAPGAPYVEVRSTIENHTRERLGPLTMADFLVLGGGTRSHAPNLGFGEIPLFTTVPFLSTGRGEHASYAFVCANHKDALIPLVDNGITVPVCDDQLMVGESAVHTRYLVAGDGSLESVARVAWGLRGDPTGTAAGTVRSPAGAPLARVWVAALAGGVVVNEARSGDDGTYVVTLPPGDYTVVAHRGELLHGAEVAVTIATGAAVALDLELPDAGVFAVTAGFLARDGAALEQHPAKLTFEPLAGISAVAAALGTIGRQLHRLSADGAFEVELPAGSYHVYVSRGFEFSRFDAVVEVVAGARVQVEATLQHVVDTTGFVAAELHQHSLGSVDSSQPVPLKVLENAAEGIEFCASTDHDNVVDFAVHVRALGLESFLLAVPGNEVTYSGLGHFNVYPWDLDPADPLRDVGSRVWWHKTAPELFADLRGMAGDAVLQVNHPRSFGGGYLSSLGLNPMDGTFVPRERVEGSSLPPTLYLDWSAGFDALEVNGSLGAPEQFTPAGWRALGELAKDAPNDVPVLADWFALLGSGLRVAAMGNSDSHNPNEGVGYPRNFVRVGLDAPAELDGGLVRDAIRAQRVAVGQGCLVELWVADQRPMGADETVPASALAELRVRAQAPGWIALDRVELYAGGVVVPLRVEDGALVADPAGVLRAPLAGLGRDAVVQLDAPVRGLAAADTVLVAVVRGSGSLAPTGSGQPYCYSAPLYVDDGAAGFTPWLAATQQVLPR